MLVMKTTKKLDNPTARMILSALRLIKMYATNPIRENKMLLAYKGIKINSDRQEQAHEAIKDLQITIQEVQNEKSNFK